MDGSMSIAQVQMEICLTAARIEEQLAEMRERVALSRRLLKGETMRSLESEKVCNELDVYHGFGLVCNVARRKDPRFDEHPTTAPCMSDPHSPAYLPERLCEHYKTGKTFACPCKWLYKEYPCKWLYQRK